MDSCLLCLAASLGLFVEFREGSTYCRDSEAGLGHSAGPPAGWGHAPGASWLCVPPPLGQLATNQLSLEAFKTLN